jgi:AcrR family transcriptional regulator
MRVTEATKSATRKRILAVAQKQFAEHGFDATTTRDVARAAKIAAGTLFNYFPTKESIVACVVGEACNRATDSHLAADPKPRDGAESGAEPLSLEESLFAYISAILRELKPYRTYLPAALDTALSPLAIDRNGDDSSLRAAHLEIVAQILSQQANEKEMFSTALQLYWTLFTGVLAFWAHDSSPRQEDTLALIDQSLSMFVGWMTSNDSQQSELKSKKISRNKR